MLLTVWQAVCSVGLVPGYMLPSPVEVAAALVKDWPALWENAQITLQEAFYGLALGVAIGFVFAVLMDAFDVLYRAFYPILVITQTIPTVAIAPLLVLWFGYEMTPKIILIILVTFFPVTVGLLDGFRAVDPDAVGLVSQVSLCPAPLLFRAADRRSLLRGGRCHQRVAGRLRRSGCLHDPGEKGLRL